MEHATAVAERQTLTQADRRRLLAVLGELCEERGHAGQGRVRSSVRGEPSVRMLADEDEQLVVELTDGLARLAGPRSEEPAAGPVGLQGALDGAEFVVRGDIIAGHSARIPEVLPSLVFLVLLPPLGQAEALLAARRAARLLGLEP